MLLLITISVVAIVLLLVGYGVYTSMYSNKVFTNPFNTIHYNADYETATVYHTLDNK